MKSGDRQALVIDDDPLLQRLVCSLLERRGFQVRGVGDVRAARQAIAEAAPDLIILDLALGNEDGVDILEHLGQIGQHPAVLPISGFDRRVLRSAVHLGRNQGLHMLEPLPKPFTASQLHEALRALPGHLLPLRESDLTRALDQDRLVLRYQPRIDLRSGAITGAEALARWQDPERGLLSPERFIALAEGGELIHALTRRVLGIALGDCATWRAAGHEIGVSVNVSARNLADPGLAPAIEEAVRLAGLPPEVLTLELTETVAMREVDATMKLLTRLRLRGFHLAIDDFGTGFSSLVELHRMPFNELKIDRSFVQPMAHDPDAAIICRAIIGLGHALGMVVVAEGVEGEEAAAMLREMGCDLAQGHHFDRALTREELLHRLDEAAPSDPKPALARG